MFLAGAYQALSSDARPPNQRVVKQIFSEASDFSSLIIEYVQRFGDFQGFFTRDNVAKLTYAAGQEEGVRSGLS